MTTKDFPHPHGGLATRYRSDKVEFLKLNLKR